MGSATVLVVDDERKIRELVRAYLERDGYAVLLADCGEQALATAARARPDLVVLDLMLPDLAGEEVARSLRALSAVPIVMLTAKAGEDDRVDGVLRRARGHGGDGAVAFDHGRLVVDREAHEVRLDGVAVALTRSEFDLLGALAGRPGRAWSRYELVTRVQGYDYDGYERTIDAHVKNLRRKLAEDPRQPRYVVTVPGVGYKFG